MPQQGTIYRVLVASPSDCDRERKIVPDTLHYWNSVNSMAIGAILEPVLWETHANPEFGDRPQAIINKQLVERCDILVGTFWTRLGSPTGEAESGTVEEIERFLKAGKPVMLYFSLVPVVPGSYDERQFEALRQYREKLRGKGLVFEYDTLASLREQLFRHLSAKIASLHGGSATPPEGQVENGQLLEFKSAFGSFMRRLDAEWSSERDSEPYTVDEGRLIMGSALRQLLTFRSQIVSDPSRRLTEILDEAIKQLRQLQHHELFIDGGVSFREFWEKGNQIVETLKKAEEILATNA